MRLKIKEPFNLPRVLTISEVKKLFNTIYSSKNTCENYLSYKYKSIVRDIAVSELLFATGIRVFELCNLKKNDMNIEHNFIYIRGKGNRERIIQICNSEITEILKEYMELFHSTDNNNSYFFLNRLGQRLSEQSVRFMLKKYTRLANIERNITPHMFRHTFATLLLEEGVDIRYIQRFLGHSSIITTQIYTHVTKHKEKEILTNKHPRGRLTFTGLKN
jgi:integrase/recombinase XerD